MFCRTLPSDLATASWSLFFVESLGIWSMPKKAFIKIFKPSVAVEGPLRASSVGWRGKVEPSGSLTGSWRIAPEFDAMSCRNWGTVGTETRLALFELERQLLGDSKNLIQSSTQAFAIDQAVLVNEAEPGGRGAQTAEGRLNSTSHDPVDAEKIIIGCMHYILLSLWFREMQSTWKEFASFSKGLRTKI